MERKLNDKIITCWTSEDIVSWCPICGAWAVVELSQKLKAIQPDDTTHVCHPGFGGCNHGFALAPTQWTST